MTKKRLSPRLVQIEPGTPGYVGYEGVYLHWCPGCGHCHMYAVEKPFPGNNNRWTFNGDVNQPAFHPSMKITWGPYGDPPKTRVCHYFVRRGLAHMNEDVNLSYIDFCGDSTHKLAGQKVLLPDVPESETTPL